LLVLRRNELRPAWKSLLLLIPILLFAFISFLRQEPLSLFLAVVVTLGSMGCWPSAFWAGAGRSTA